MANQSINAVKIIPNDNINLPEPGIKTSGASTTGTSGVTLKDSSNDFLNSVTNPNGYNVNGGDVVYNTSTNAVAKVLQAPETEAHIKVEPDTSALES